MKSRTEDQVEIIGLFSLLLSFIFGVLHGAALTVFHFQWFVIPAVLSMFTSVGCLFSLMLSAVITSFKR
jgi:uncharacterized membrane protein YoaK (UPF0700 family)